MCQFIQSRNKFGYKDRQTFYIDVSTAKIFLQWIYTFHTLSEFCFFLSFAHSPSLWRTKTIFDSKVYLNKIFYIRICYTFGIQVFELFTAEQNKGKEDCFEAGICVDSFLVHAELAHDEYECLSLCSANENCTWITYSPLSYSCLQFSNCSRIDSSQCSTCLSGEKGKLRKILSFVFSQFHTEIYYR